MRNSLTTRVSRGHAGKVSFIAAEDYCAPDWPTDATGSGHQARVGHSAVARLCATGRVSASHRLRHDAGVGIEPGPASCACVTAQRRRRSAASGLGLATHRGSRTTHPWRRARCTFFLASASLVPLRPPPPPPRKAPLGRLGQRASVHHHGVTSRSRPADSRSIASPSMNSSGQSADIVCPAGQR